jgi:hypothetical protein
MRNNNDLAAEGWIRDVEYERVHEFNYNLTLF